MLMMILGIIVAFVLVFLAWRCIVGLVEWLLARGGRGRAATGLVTLLILSAVALVLWIVLGPFAWGSVDAFIGLMV